MEGSSSVMDGNIPIYIFGLVTFIGTLFTMGWAMIRFTREGDQKLHDRINEIVEKHHIAETNQAYFNGRHDEFMDNCKNQLILTTTNSQCLQKSKDV